MIRLRRVLRDLAAACAFGSMALSGSVPSWAMAAFALALILSLAGVRSFNGRPSAGGVLLIAAALGLLAATVRGWMDPIVAACSFASLVTATRLQSDPTAPHDRQVLLTSFLMVSGGAALSSDLAFAPCLVGFAVFASLSQGLAVIEGTDPAAVAGATRPAFVQLGFGLSLAVVSALAFFILFPRLSWNVVSRPPSVGFGAATTGLSDTVQLSSNGGSIKTNPRVVLRARLSPDPGRERLDAYWIGRRYDAFDGQRWVAGGQPEPARPALFPAPDGPTSGVQQRIELLPAYGSRTLVALETPVRWSNLAALTVNGPQRGGLIAVRGVEVRADAASPAVVYAVLSAQVPEPALEGSDLQTYLQLPALDRRVTALARRVAGTAPGPLEAADLLKRHLTSSYAYSLELANAPEDPLAHFLFERKAGHCEHFATALAVMLRSLGHPARVVGGFYGGERSGEDYVVRAGDAHAWVQVYVPGRGFLSVDATPESNRSARPPGLLLALSRLYERAEGWWRSRVVDYSFRDQVRLAREWVVPPARSTAAERPLLPRLPRRNAVLVALGAAALAFVAWRRFAPSAVPARRRHPAEAFLSAIERTLAKGGVRPHPGEGIEELVRRLGVEGHPASHALGAAARRYLDARFGAAPVSRPEQRALLDALRSAAQMTVSAR